MIESRQPGKETNSDFKNYQQYKSEVTKNPHGTNAQEQDLTDTTQHSPSMDRSRHRQQGAYWSRRASTAALRTPTRTDTLRAED